MKIDIMKKALQDIISMSFEHTDSQTLGQNVRTKALDALEDKNHKEFLSDDDVKV